MLSERARAHLSKPSEIRAAFEKAAELSARFGDDQVHKLCIGNPEIPAPAGVRQAMAEALQEEEAAGGDTTPFHGYICDAGFAETREAVAQNLNARFDTAYTQESIIMTSGAACALNIALSSLLDPGDEVVVFTPCYPAYRRFIENWGGCMVACPTSAPEFQPNLEAFARAITPRTKAVIVNSPNNPSGAVYSRETLKGLASVMEDAQQRYGAPICLLSDEPYRELAFDGVEVPYTALFYRNTVTAYSFSKSLSLPGERIGYAVVPDEVEEAPALRRAMRTSLGDLGFVNAPAFFQRVVARCLDARIDVEAYAQSRAALVQGLRKLGFRAEWPQGGFYLFLETPIDETEFLDHALTHRLVLVGGSAFGQPGFVRISFCLRRESIEAALPAFEALAQELGLPGET